MSMNFSISSFVPLHLITENDHWNIHPFLDSEIPTGLAESFKNAGILQPPLIRDQGDGTFELIAGKRRLLAAKEICGLSSCHCFVVPLTTTPEVLLSLLVENQSLSAPFSPMEAAHFFRIGARYLQIEELARRYLPRLTGKTNLSHLKGYHLLLSLEQKVQLLVHSLFITENMAYELVKLGSADRLALIRLFRDFQLGGGKQKRLFSLLRDVAQRKEIQISTLIHCSEINEILQHKEMNNPQKMLNLLSLLQQTATPSLHADEEQFRSSVSKLKLPPSCTIQHSPAFEMDAVELTIKFDDFDRLRKAWPELQRTLQEK